MKRLLPNRLRINEERKDKSKDSYFADFDEEVLEQLSPKYIDKFINAKISQEDLCHIDIIELYRILVGKKFSPLLEGAIKMKEKAQHAATRKVNLGISIITSDEEKRKELDRVNASIKTIVQFKSDILPNGRSSTTFDAQPLDPQRRFNYWIQDMFLVEQKSDSGQEEEVYQLIDDSLGKIEHIALSYYDNNNEATRNSYNKIYVDLLIKLAKIYDHEEVKMNSRRAIKFIGHRGNQKSTFNNLMDKLRESYGYKVNHKAFKNLLIKGGNILFAGGRALIGYDAVIETYSDKEFNAIKETLYGLAYRKYEHSTSTRKIIWQRIKQVIPEGNPLRKGSGKITRSNLFKSQNKIDMVIDVLRHKFRKRCSEWEADFKKEFSALTRISPNNIIFIGSKEVLLEMILMDIDLVNHQSRKEVLSWINDGCSAQGIFHIDLFISAAGKDEIRNNNRLLVGKPIYTGNQHIPLFHFTKKVLENIASKLVMEGFSVHRIPLPLTYVDRWKNKDKKEFERIWFFASYNNCLVQYTKNPRDRYVWMPVYGSDFSNEYLLEKPRAKNCRNNLFRYGNWSYLKQYDEESKQVWQELSFQVENLTNYLPFAEMRGAARCLSKVLCRAPF